MNKTIKTIAMAALAAFTFGFARGANAAGANEVQYLAQCALVWSSTSDEKAEKILRDNGWTPVGADFNAGASGYWVRMGVKYTTDPALAITAFAVYNGENAPNTFERDGITFYKIGSGCVDWCPHTLDGPVDLNEHAGGDYLYIYATRDPKAGPRITDFYQSQNKDKEPAMKGITDRGYEPVYDQNGNWADCNSGTGDDFLFEGYKGETVYRYPVYNVPGDPTSGVREWLMGSTNATTVAGSSSEVTWSAGWYAVRSDIAITESAVCKGDVHLILCDGAKLTVTRTTDGPGIRVARAGNALTIYGQALGTGQLKSTGKMASGIGSDLHGGSVYNITINGGIVTATGGDYGAAIGGGFDGEGENITINGGTVTATGGTSGAGIGGGPHGKGNNITVNGGKVTATGGNKGAGIGGGNDAAGNNITVNGGTVTATGGSESSPGIGGGYDGSATNIYVSSSLYVLADGSNPPTTSISHSSTEDIAKKLTEYRRQHVRIGTITTTISTQPIPVEHTTFAVYTNGVLSVDGTAWSNDYATVVYTADEGYAFERGPLSATNVLDTTTDPAVNAGGVPPAAPVPYIDCLAPVYRTPGDPKSGIDHWVTNTVRAYAIVRSTMTTWGVEGATKWYVVTEDTTIANRITCVGDVRLILKDGTTLNAQAGITASTGAYEAPIDYLGFTVYAQSEGATMGALVATSAIPSNHAAIGGGSRGVGNNITVNGGTVTATGGNKGAGIGGGSSGSASDITVNGGTVTATGVSAPGIGGGNGGSGNNITVNGGTVTATGGYSGAGIGGSESGAGNNIMVNGGTVTATGGDYGAGIGGGRLGAANNITVNGGTVTAKGGGSGAGIGGGYCHTRNVENITVNGGTVTATGGYSGAGIGGGQSGSVSRITINGGEVTATGYSGMSPGIGGGNYGSATGIYVSSSLYVRADSSNPPADLIFHSTTEDIAKKLTEYRRQYVRIGPITTTISTQPISVEHTTYSVYTNGVLSVDGTAWSNDYATVVYTAGKGFSFLPDGSTVVTNVLDTTKDPAGNAGGVAPAAPIPHIDCLAPVYRTPGDPTSGIDHWVTNTVRAYAIVRSTMTTWGVESATKWYVVAEDTTIANRITCVGDVRLILKDGTTLNAQAGITASADTAGYLGFAVYAQSTNAMMGALVATNAIPANHAAIGGGNDAAGNNITVNGGTVTATGGDYGAAIGGGFDGAGNNITVNGGTVTATGGDLGVGIGGGFRGAGNNLTVNGGTVTATGGSESSPGIGGGYGGSSSNIRIDRGVLCVKADGNNPPVTPIANDGGDLASKLAGRRYATVRPGGSIDVAAAEHGTAAVVPAANSNETVTVTAKPASDYYLSAISVVKTGEETRQIPLTRTKDNVYTFTMPDYAVTVRTAFFPHPSITGVTAQQRYPWNGMVDIAYAVSVDASDDYALRVQAVDRTTGVTNEATALTVGARALSKGAHTLTWDMGADGIALVSTNVVFIVSAEPRDAVQLWAGGPYFATENVGANKPQDYGYHFWWGDTVGYTNKTSKGEWYSVKDGTAFSFDAEHCTTYDKDNSQLQAAGYIDATGNLTAEHDAATAHLGVLWRMLTEDEVNQLVDTKNCLRTWTENWQGTGTNGYVVTGAQKGYQSKSIFLPAGGFGSESGWSGPNAVGDFCSSKPDSNVQRAVVLNFSSSNFRRSLYSRAYGYSIRPVWSGTPAVGVSSPVGLDLRADVVREVMAPETLTYTTNYPGGAVADATVAITVNGETKWQGLMGAGTVEWTPTQAGTNELRHIVTAGGTTIADLTARFYVPGVKVGASAFAVTRTGVCELFGGGATYDGTGVLPEKASVTNVVIANGITGVGKDFFADCPGLTTVTGGRDLASVGTNAFCNCPALTAITLDCTEIPEGLGDSVTYRTMLAPDGTIWQVPTISITGYVETLYGKEKLNDAEWKDLGPAAGAIIYEQGGYHFFRVRLEKAE